MSLWVSPPIRGFDKHGSGEYQAPRGQRKHNGIDFSVYPGSGITAAKGGTVTRIGYPYSPSDRDKGHLRYVQVTDERGYEARYFYVFPTVNEGDYIPAGAVIGHSQRLSVIYPGITDHIHIEVKDRGEFINPLDYLPAV